jgi:transcription initiation factor TFIID subunit 10
MASSSVISGPIPPPRSLPVTEPQPAPDSLALKYRGATVEDLQLSPAVCVPTTATVGAALQVAFDHEYEQLPVLSSSNGNRKLLGYLDVKKLRAEVDAGRSSKGDGVLKNMVKFGGSNTEVKDKSTYTLISPETGLGELECEFSGGEQGAQWYNPV